MSKFQTSNSFESRRQTFENIRIQYPERIAIIVEPNENCRIRIDKNKFLVPSEMTMGHFIYEIRKHMKFEEYSNIFMFVANNVIPSSNSTMSSLYSQYCDPDGFLYISYSQETSFGSRIF